MVQDTAVSDIKLQATIRKIDQDESNASSPFAGFIHLVSFFNSPFVAKQQDRFLC